MTNEETKLSLKVETPVALTEAEIDMVGGGWRGNFAFADAEAYAFGSNTTTKTWTAAEVTPFSSASASSSFAASY